VADIYETQLANIEKVQAQCMEASLEDFGWDDDAREAVLRGEMPKFPPRGRPLIEVPGAPRLSSYAEFANLKVKVNRERGQAQTSPEVVKAAEQRMDEVLAKAAELVEPLLKLAAEANALYQVVTAARLAQVHVGTPIPGADGHSYENRSGSRMQAKAGGITAGDLVDLVLDPRRDPFELEKVPVPQRLSFAAGLGQRERPEPPPEPPSEALLEAMAKEKQQRAARLGVHPSQLRS